MRKNKRGVSDVVITVSMILISIVAVGVISAFVVPMIQKQLGKTSACLALREHFKVRTDISATCYNATTAKLSISRGSEKEEASGFSISLISSTGEASAYRILNNTAPGLPTRGGAKVFYFDISGNLEKATVSTILPTDETCDGVDFTGIRPC
jgi:hypothetical protein